VASVRGDQFVVPRDPVLDTHGYSLLTNRQVTEAADFALEVKTVDGHFHMSKSTVSTLLVPREPVVGQYT